MHRLLAILAAVIGLAHPQAQTLPAAFTASPAAVTPTPALEIPAPTLELELAQIITPLELTPDQRDRADCTSLDGYPFTTSVWQAKQWAQITDRPAPTCVWAGRLEGSR